MQIYKFLFILQNNTLLFLKWLRISVHAKKGSGLDCLSNLDLIDYIVIDYIV